MISDRCRVTVIIPVYNSAATLRRAADSVSRQTMPHLEMLIVEDGSTDGSTAEARAIAAAEPRARVIEMPRNGGKPRAVNRASAEARGEWIAILDADDEYDPGRLEVLLATAEAYRADIVADNQVIYDAGAGCAVGVALPGESEVHKVSAAEFAARCDPYASFDYGMLKPMVRTAFLRDCGVQYRENARLSEDFLFLAELFAAGAHMVLVPQPLYVWTQAFGSISRSWTTTGGGAWRYDFASAVRTHIALRADFERRGEAEFAALLARRARAFRRLMVLSGVSRARAERASLPRVAVMVLRHPSIWPAVARRLVTRFVEGANHSGAGARRQAQPAGAHIGAD
jgi:succinoglycan biosynthesis protein ExoO